MYIKSSIHTIRGNVEIIVEDGIIKNLEELMKEAKWQDNPSDEPICCHSSRQCMGELDGVTYGVCEIHRCCPHQETRVFVRDSPKKAMILEYHTMPVYHRCPHTKKTYVRDSVGDLRRETREYNPEKSLTIRKIEEAS